ncbi:MULTISPECIES: DUF397 domain-containing protein [unclassified Streptomyces]|uniref:DUF397 domain-containing protein n=1 Tax=unclassified Streptomyces TaxID=2593676 RepID=UPI0009989E1F|nr:MULTISPECIES: DUF397 domain-containing protein [unclassified Streptomyces]MYT31947.1 DUF397 domain-containing protein [Streptomyces sp. SID8354]
MRDPGPARPCRVVRAVCLAHRDVGRSGSSASPVRGSKAPRGPVVVVPAGAWSAFVAAVKGEG